MNPPLFTKSNCSLQKLWSEGEKTNCLNCTVKIVKLTENDAATKIFIYDDKEGRKWERTSIKTFFCKASSPSSNLMIIFFIQSALEIIPLCAKTNSTNGCSNDTSMVFHWHKKYHCQWNKPNIIRIFPPKIQRVPTTFRWKASNFS